MHTQDPALATPIALEGNLADVVAADTAARLLEQATHCGMVILDLGGRIVRANRAYCDLLGRPGPEVLSRDLCSDFCAEDHHPRLEEWIHGCCDGASPLSGIDIQLLHKDGRRIWVGLLATKLGNSDGTPAGLVVTVIDLQLRKQFEHRLERANRALFMMSGCSMAVARADDEADLLQEVCRIAVDVGGYCLAWVGLVEHDEARTIRPVARWGRDEGYVDMARLTWSSDERGQGPTGAAIRLGEPCVARAIADDARYSPWRREALLRGYASSIAVPLLQTGQPLAVLNLYAAEPDAFDEVEIDLLRDVGANLAHGIAALRARQARDAAQRELTETLAALETTIHQRTEELRHANEMLQAQLTERTRVETALRRRLTAEHLVTGMSSRFVRSLPEEVESAVTHSLGELGRFVESAVCTLGVLSQDRTGVDKIYWWHSDADDSQQCRVSMEGFEWAFSKIRSERKLQAFTSDSVAEPLRDFCRSLGWYSFLSIPLFREQELTGLLAFGCTDAGRMWQDDDFAVLQLAGELFIGVLERARTDRELARHRARLEDSERELQQFSRRLLAIREEEKQGLSSVLHHEVGSMAVGLTSKFHVAAEAMRRGDSDDATNAIEEGKALLEDVVRRLKGLAADLRPPDLDILGITAALRLLVSQVSDRAGIPIKCSVKVHDADVGSRRSIVVFRLVQESLNNIALHSEATRASIQLSGRDGRVVVRVKDDGKGFDTQSIASAPTCHMGIRAMREMVASVHGAFEVKSIVGQGTQIHVALPAGGNVE
ncbi:GAF domain-containing protein [Candidatus Fermentibacteria bacterium]|nr:GAF domain-containing protein [Candidatus Fermentibacteria bacterium]